MSAKYKEDGATFTHIPTPSPYSTGQNDVSWCMGTDDREQGIDFGGLDEMHEQQNYPVTMDELLDEYGEYEI